jgi:tetratricopeptide (TPR) repeat protein
VIATMSKPVLFKLAALICLVTVIMLINVPATVAQELPALERATEVRDSLRTEWARSEGFEHAVLSEQLGVWAFDPGYILPGEWDDRTQAMYELAMLSAVRFDVQQPGYITRRGEQVTQTAIHWSKGLRELRRVLLTERFDRFDEAYFMTWPVLPSVRSLAEGELALRRQDAAGALAAFTNAKTQAEHPRVAGEASVGIARALYEQREFQACFDTLVANLDQGAFGVEAMQQMGLTLIRLGRVREATAIFQFALEINPLHERAHYMLGNGYARYNYSQLEYEYPHIIPEGSAAERLASAKQHLRDGQQDLALATLESLALSQPVLIEPRTILAELAWMDGGYDTAERFLTEALESCPDHGRAHAVLARVQEMRRLEQSQRRQVVRDSILAKPMAQIEGIETFISNWDALSPELQQIAASAVEPWAAFVPALNDAGQTHYIKPMYELLSAAPHMESLKDQRINLDSRLWDDVRGVGGFHSVTGVEDVRRMAYGGYNTLVHELTHQVHGIFTPEQKDAVEELYRAAKAREDEGQLAFMSRYQASTVWEFLAEGVNAYVTPAVDEYDEREMLYDRLHAIDPDLEALVVELLAVTDVRENIAVARVNSAMQHLEYEHADSAWIELEQVDPEWSDRSYVLSARAYVASVLDRDAEAVHAALSFAEGSSDDGDAWVSLASALEFGPKAANLLPDSLDTPLEVMRTGLLNVGESDEIAVRLALARYAHQESLFDEAITQCDAVLQLQANHPTAIWQRANSRARLAWQGETLDSTIFEQSVADYESAVLMRSGVMGLRLDYARDLIFAGRLDEADAQIIEAETLHPNDPLPMTYRAWLLRLQGDVEASDHLFSDALAIEPTPDDAHVLAAHFGIVDARSVETLLNQWTADGPNYVYNPRQYYYQARQMVYPWMHRL